MNISKIENTISDKAQKYVGSDFAHLTNADDRNTMNAEYITKKEQAENLLDT